MPVITFPEPVEIDECHVGAKIRGSHGRPPAPGKVVFGIKCRTTGLALIFPVPDKSKETLLPIIIIVEHVTEGSEVISDKFASYVTRNGRSHLEDLGYEHYFINYSLSFVDPIQPFIHTNTIGRTWRSFKASISHVKRSLSDETIDAFISVFQFYNFFSKDVLYDIFLQILVSRQH